ncbi:MAG: undecaprenyl-phosphate glucose phosphotransferase [Chloroflexota bacterium]
MKTQQIRTIYTISLVCLDVIAIILALFAAYFLRQMLPYPEPLENPVFPATYFSLLAIQIVMIVAAQFYNRQYYIPRALSRVDQFYYSVVSVTIGHLLAMAIAIFLFKDSEVIRDYPRALTIYAWLCAIIFMTLMRALHHQIRVSLQQRGIGKDRVLLIGSGETARIILQRILWSPQLGYELVGIVTDERGYRKIQGVPVLGRPQRLSALIDRHHIDEIIVAIPEKGHRETVRIISYCERGRVSIKVFPDIFQSITSQEGIDDLGGLPLLTVRNFAMRGYLLIFKRLLDLFGSLVGLIFLSPLMLLVAVAIKLESPGPVFFVQERMGLDGNPFLMLKFRSMRSDAEKEGPGWTTERDPRQTSLGTFLRAIKVDELPQLINVFLGEMSLVGPRPEQAYYVDQFRESVPRYMERHREKGGMTGWAQLHGLQGDTSIAERTKYDLWYSENWSVWLDIKIIMRTLWKIVEPKRGPRFAPPIDVPRGNGDGVNGRFEAPTNLLIPDKEMSEEA